jgi:large subunit ribosomal protein L33
MRDTVQMQCTECKRKNYTTDKNKKTTPGKLEFKKFCKFCGNRKVHRESK